MGGMINDPVDMRILKVLQQDARTSTAEIARQLGMAASGIHERIKKLEARGVLKAYEARINPQALGLGLLAFIFVRVDEGPGCWDACNKLAEIPEVQELHHIAGEDCYLLKVRTESAEALGQLLRTRIGTIPTVRSTRSTIVMGTIKESTQLAIAEPEAEKAAS